MQFDHSSLVKRVASFKYLIILVVWVTILTYVNNYFFFQHAARDIDRNIVHLAQSSKTFISYCMKDTQKNSSECIQDLKDFLEKTPVYYKAAYTLKNQNNDIIFTIHKIYSKDKYDLKYIQENKNLIKFSKLFKKFNLTLDEVDNLNYLKEISAFINIENYPPSSTAQATFNSLTFSVKDWFPKIVDGKYREAFELILHVALPRSWSAIFLIIFALVMYKFLKYEEKQYFLKLEEQEKNMLFKIRENKYSNILKNELVPYKSIIEKTISIDVLFELIEKHPAGVIIECRKLSELIVDSLKNYDDYMSQIEKINDLYTSGILDEKCKSNLHNLSLFGTKSEQSN